MLCSNWEKAGVCTGTAGCSRTLARKSPWSLPPKPQFSKTGFCTCEGKLAASRQLSYTSTLSICSGPTQPPQTQHHEVAQAMFAGRQIPRCIVELNPETKVVNILWQVHPRNRPSKSRSTPAPSKRHSLHWARIKHCYCPGHDIQPSDRSALPC